MLGQKCASPLHWHVAKSGCIGGNVLEMYNVYYLDICWTSWNYSRHEMLNVRANQWKVHGVKSLAIWNQWKFTCYNWDIDSSSFYQGIFYLKRFFNTWCGSANLRVDSGNMPSSISMSTGKHPSLVSRDLSNQLFCLYWPTRALSNSWMWPHFGVQKTEVKWHMLLIVLNKHRKVKGRWSCKLYMVLWMTAKLEMLNWDKIGVTKSNNILLSLTCIIHIHLSVDVFGT